MTVWMVDYHSYDHCFAVKRKYEKSIVADATHTKTAYVTLQGSFI